jgi:UDP-3-O-[3-hydroxymyristoyl] N-acetylglucosamine deacetylase
MVTVEGIGLFTAAPVRVTLARARGRRPVVFRSRAGEATLRDLRAVAEGHATTLLAEHGALRIATVEHFLAVLAAMRIRQGLVVECDGPEMPCLDGGAGVWCDRLESLALAPTRPVLRVARKACIEAGTSRYEFAPGDGVHVRACIDFGDVRLAPEASWGGDADDFRARIAPARTFVLAAELAALAERGATAHVAPESVVVIAPDAIATAGRPFAEDEPARHKLLDLIGDLYPYGGPPLGSVVAHRPGHAATHAILPRALAEGIVMR